MTYFNVLYSNFSLQRCGGCTFGNLPEPSF